MESTTKKSVHSAGHKNVEFKSMSYQRISVFVGYIESTICCHCLTGWWISVTSQNGYGVTFTIFYTYLPSSMQLQYTYKPILMRCKAPLLHPVSKSEKSSANQGHA